jgi:hypothetical protein
MPSKRRLLKIKKRKKARRAVRRAKKQTLKKRRKEQEDYGEDVLGLDSHGNSNDPFTAVPPDR